MQTVPVRPQALEDRLVAAAVLVAPWQKYAFATSRIEGRITALHIHPGQTVQAGQPWPRCKAWTGKPSAGTRQRRDRCEAVRGKPAQLETAALSKAITPQEVQEARTRHQENLVNLTVAQRKLRSLGVDDAFLDRLQSDRTARPLQTLPIRSPIAGEVVHADVRLGQSIQPSDHLDRRRRSLPHLGADHAFWKRTGAQSPSARPSTVHLSAHPFGSLRGTVEVKGQGLDPETFLGTVWGLARQWPTP